MSETLSLLKQMPVLDRPRERLLRQGSAALSDLELVAVLLRTGRPGLSALEMAGEVLAECGGLVGLQTAKVSSLRRRGVGNAKAAALLAAAELGKRLAHSRIPRREPLESPDTVARYLSLRYGVLDQEIMGALYLDIRQRLISEEEIFRGTLSRAMVEPRAIFREALVRGASGFVLFHTHPSGDPTPSVEDLSFTRRMVEAGDLLGVRLVDHMILGGGGRWISLRRRGAW